MEEFFKNKWVAYIALAIVGYSGVVDVNMALNPNARPDSYTGTRGDKHEHRTTELEEWAIITDLRLQAIESHDNDCEKRVNGLQQGLRDHLKFSERKVLEIDRELTKHSVKLEDCIEHMRNDK